MVITDIVMIVLFIIVLVIIIGLNIVSMIDKKLGNIEIVVPPVKPTLIVKIDKSDIDGYQIHANGEKMQKDRQGDYIAENFTSVASEENKLPKYEFKEEDKKSIIKEENIKELERESNPKIYNPDESNVVEYGNYICYKRDVKNNLDKAQNNKVTGEEVKQSETKETEEKRCNNESLNKKFSYGVQALDPFPVGYQKSWYDVDPADYFRKYKPMPIPIEDKLIKGYNIGEFNTAGGIYDVGRINLKDKKARYAQPNNYLLGN